MMSQNPMVQQLQQTNPQAAAMMSNPEMMRAMMRPENLRAMMQMQQSMQQFQSSGNFPAFPPMTMPQPTQGDSNGIDNCNNGRDSNIDFASLLNQMQSANINGQAAQQQQQQHPADRYRSQLQSLRDMGFDDEQASLRALHANRGNLNRAVYMLLMGNVPSFVPGLDDTNIDSNTNTSSNRSAANAENADSTDSNEPPAEVKDSKEKKND